MTSNAPRTSRRTRKIAAIAAGIAVVGVGATYTLASWTDSEWVSGTADGAGIGTSSFNIEQHTHGSDDWSDRETNPGGSLTFTASPLALTPGDSVYAPVSLRTEPGSIAGAVTLQSAVPAAGVVQTDPDGLLWDAVEVSAYTTDGTAIADAPDCTPGGFDAAEWTSLWVGAALTGAPALAEQELAADAASNQHYCFVITLPADAQSGTDTVLMGRSIAPAWAFAGVSD